MKQYDYSTNWQSVIASKGYEDFSGLEHYCKWDLIWIIPFCLIILVIGFVLGIFYWLFPIWLVIHSVCILVGFIIGGLR